MDRMIVVIATSCALLAIANVLHAAVGGGLGSMVLDNAVRNAMRDFMGGKQRVQDSTSTSSSASGKDKSAKSTASKIAGLSCPGVSPADAKEMVYWENLPSDALHVSPFHQTKTRQYMTFEPDGGGWNNIRMALETVLGLAIAST
jgi:hypothetical protein